MRAITVVAADDEPIVREDLRQLLAAEGDAVLVAEARDGFEALEQVAALEPDVLLLDVQMPHMSGLEVAAALDPERAPLIVMVTAFDQYALAAFDLHAVDYLLKPFDGSRFRRAFSRVRARLGAGGRGGLPAGLAADGAFPPPRPERLAVRRQRGAVIVAVEDVIWCEAADNYVRLHLRVGRELTRRTMAELEQLLDPGRFRRVSRSAIVNLAYVKRVEPAGHGDWTLVLSTGIKLLVSRNYRHAFLGAIGGIA